MIWGMMAWMGLVAAIAGGVMLANLGTYLVKETVYALEDTYIRVVRWLGG